MDPELRALAVSAKGFMPEEEGDALYRAALDAADNGPGPFLEVGAYCGKSAVYLGAAARQVGRVLFSLDHHRGSEENQAGWEHHDPEVVDPSTGRMDTLPFWRATIEAAGLEHCVVALVGDSPTIAGVWTTPLAFLFIDGGHGAGPAWADYRGWSPRVGPGGLLAIHDVYPDPADGGRSPFEIYCAARESGNFDEISIIGSLRVLQRR